MPLKKRPSSLGLHESGLDLSDNIEPPLSTTSSTYSVAEEETDMATHESSDKLSPLKSLNNNSHAEEKVDAASMDISGGVGTPCYVVDMDNLFEQDTILGVGPKKPSCFYKLFCSAAKVEQETDRLKAIHRAETGRKTSMQSYTSTENEEGTIADA